jgi:hypothetical protein
MSKERELLRKALHVLTSSKVWGGQEYTYLPIHPCQYKGISAEIKELLAQPEQEPVAWMWTRNYEGGGYTNMVFQMKCEADEYAKDSESLKRPDLVRPLYLGVDDE